jgi:hypothetical protein
VRSCTYPIVVRDTDGVNGSAPKRRPGARGFVVQVRRAAGIRYVARVVVGGQVRDVPGGARATRPEAQAALDLALAVTRPCGAETFGEDLRCYWHAKLEAAPAVNGHDASDGWQQVDLGAVALEGFDPLEHRPTPPPRICEICDGPVTGQRGARYCSAACKSTAYARRRGARPRLTPTGRQLVSARRASST